MRLTVRFRTKLQMKLRVVAVVDRCEENPFGIVQPPRKTVHDLAVRHRTQDSVNSLTDVLIKIEDTVEEGSPAVSWSEKHVAEVDPTGA